MNPRTLLPLLCPLLVACASGGDSAPAGPEDLGLGPSLQASFDDPLLLTMAAATSRSRYLPDEGYTLARADGLLPAFVTDTAGNLGLAFQVDGRAILRETELHAPPVLEHTASDSLVLTLPLTATLTAQVRFLVATSSVATIEVALDGSAAEVTVLAWLRRCAEPYTDVAARDDGLAAEHHDAAPMEQVLLAPGTYIEDLGDALVMDGDGVTAVGLGACAADAGEDVGALLGADALPGTAAWLGVKQTVTVSARAGAIVRVHRAVVDSAETGALDAELERTRALDVVAELQAGHARLEAISELADLDREQALAYRSAFALLDQLFYPPEGKLAHEYYLFAREPSWWFAHMGQHIHESLAMALLVRFQPERAMESQRVFIERVESDGYLPYNIGPVLEQTSMGTASAPMLSFVNWEVYRQTQDVAFLAEAYAAGVKTHAFWDTQRDTDGDGLIEWGGYALTESVRDLENVIWEEVAPPEDLEAIDASCWVVLEERSLASMAAALGKDDEAAQWQAAADERAARIDAVMWDEETGFYYHVEKATNSFDYAAPGDLKRQEIAGLMPLFTGVGTAEHREKLLDALFDEERFWRPAGVPGLAADDPYYDSAASQCCRWNGPIWVQWQWLILRGLLAHDRPARAIDLTNRVFAAVQAQLARVHQFRELYDADDPIVPNNSMPNYIWTTLAALMKLEVAEMAR